MKKCVKALNLLRVVCNTAWGGDRTVLLRLYRALARSELDMFVLFKEQHANPTSLCWIQFKTKV